MEITIQGQKFNVPEKYAEGHTLNANEASALNQLLAENLRNNFSGRVKKATEEGQTDGLQGEFDTYAQNYQFGVRRAGGARVTDPVEKRALKLAKDALRAQAKKLQKEFSAEQIDTMAPAFLERYPHVREEARRQIESEKNIAVDELNFDDLPQSGADAPVAEASTGADESPTEGNNEASAAPTRRRR